MCRNVSVISDLRRTMTGRSVSAVKTPSVLSDTEFRGFWIHLRNGDIEVGREGETLPYFHWKDPDPIPVQYYSFSSWVNSAAKWVHRCNVGGAYFTMKTFRPIQIINVNHWFKCRPFTLVFFRRCCRKISRRSSATHSAKRRGLLQCCGKAKESFTTDV